jgi:hypothetical protein
MSEEEALKLIDAINYPHRILQTEYRDVPASTESLVRVIVGAGYNCFRNTRRFYYMFTHLRAQHR